MSAIDPEQFSIAPSPQDLVDEAFVNSTLGGGQGTSGWGQAQATEPPEEQALDAFNSFTQASQSYFNRELSLGVPADYLSAREATSTLVGSMVADSTEALASSATLSPAAALSLLAL